VTLAWILLVVAGLLEVVWADAEGNGVGISFTFCHVRRVWDAARSETYPDPVISAERYGALFA